MFAIRKILVPVDFSECSESALDAAVGFAKAFGAEVHLLHCYQVTPATVAPYGIVVPETFEHDVRQAALRRLGEERARVSGEGLHVQEHISPRFPSEEIPAMAEKLGADLIVMGTRGLTGVKHVLLGSVAERTVRGASCPVLTVKNGEAH
jgi:nucleotide-binding universal stress UspA family protein